MSSDGYAFFDPSLEDEIQWGKPVRDCDHIRCHSPLGTEACLRHHIAYLEWRIKELTAEKERLRDALDRQPD